jgi:hypothetical protein
MKNTHKHTNTKTNTNSCFQFMQAMQLYYPHTHKQTKSHTRKTLQMNEIKRKASCMGWVGGGEREEREGKGEED